MQTRTVTPDSHGLSHLEPTRSVWANARCIFVGVDRVLGSKADLRMICDQLPRRGEFATIALIEGKQPVSVVSQRLGHANTSITLDFYAHAMPRDDEEAAAAVAALVVPEGF